MTELPELHSDNSAGRSWFWDLRSFCWAPIVNLWIYLSGINKVDSVLASTSVNRWAQHAVMSLCHQFVTQWQPLPRMSIHDTGCCHNITLIYNVVTRSIFFFPMRSNPSDCWLWWCAYVGWWWIQHGAMWPLDWCTCHWRHWACLAAAGFLQTCWVEALHQHSWVCQIESQCWVDAMLKMCTVTECVVGTKWGPC